MADSYRVIERPQGVGTLLNADGSEIGKRSYSLIVSEKRIDVGHGETIPGMPRIQGRIALHGMEGYTFVSVNAELTLKLQDGRLLPFFFTSTDGAIAARGQLE